MRPEVGRLHPERVWCNCYGTGLRSFEDISASSHMHENCIKIFKKLVTAETPLPFSPSHFGGIHGVEAK